MKYSVLMSVYKNDNPLFLELALKSIYEEQTRKPDEVVVVFDGPLTEGLYQVLDRFECDKKDVVKYVNLDANRGLGEALRIGSNECTGDYIFRMDSDDISDKMRFEKQIAYIEKHPQIDVLGTNIAEFESSIDEEMRVRVCPQKHEEIVRMAKKRNPMNHVTVCIKREALKKCGGYESLLLLEDYYLWLKMIVSNCKLENLNENLVYVRIGNGFNAKRGSKVRIKGWKSIQRFMLQHRMIKPLDAFTNMISIVLFTYCPQWVRKWAYEKILRRK